MLRWIMPCLVAVFGIGTADASDGPTATKRAAYRATSKLPPGLPRAHYNYRTTIAPPAPPYMCGVAGNWSWRKSRTLTCCSRRSAWSPMPRLCTAYQSCRAPTLCLAIMAPAIPTAMMPLLRRPLHALLESPAIRRRRLRLSLKPVRF